MFLLKLVLVVLLLQFLLIFHSFFSLLYPQVSSIHLLQYFMFFRILSLHPWMVKYLLYLSRPLRRITGQHPCHQIFEVIILEWFTGWVFLRVHLPILLWVLAKTVVELVTCLGSLAVEGVYSWDHYKEDDSSTEDVHLSAFVRTVLVFSHFWRHVVYGAAIG